MADTTESRVRALLAAQPTIGLAEMDGAALMNRVDRKYVLPVEHMLAVLETVLPHYRVLQVDGHRLFSYNTRYFDTPDYRFYQDHHNGVANRVKVRCREYIETGACFFEVKRKVGGTRTDKHRRPVDAMMCELTKEDYADVHYWYTRRPFTTLGPVLDNTFRRMTLVGAAERCTIDFDLCFEGFEKSHVSCDGIAVIEVKQACATERSRMAQVLKSARFYPCPISKYAYGTVVTAARVKRNAFKTTVRRIERLQAV